MENKINKLLLENADTPIKFDDNSYGYCDIFGNISDERYSRAWRYENGYARVVCDLGIRYRDINGQLHKTKEEARKIYKETRRLIGNGDYQSKENIIKILKIDPSQFLNIPEFLFADDDFIQECITLTNICDEKNNSFNSSVVSKDSKEDLCR